MIYLQDETISIHLFIRAISAEFTMIFIVKDLLIILSLMHHVTMSPSNIKNVSMFVTSVFTCAIKGLSNCYCELILWLVDIFIQSASSWKSLSKLTTESDLTSKCKFCFQVQTFSNWFHRLHRYRPKSSTGQSNPDIYTALWCSFCLKNIYL